MSRLASQKTRRIDLGAGEWVDIRVSLSFVEFQSVLGDAEKESRQAQLETALGILRKAVKDWHLLDDDGNPVPYSPEKIGDLDMRTILDLQNEVMAQYGLDKKKSLHPQNNCSE